jgi:signal transduction histidine kinase
MAIGDNPVWLAHVLALVLTAATQAGLAAWIFARKWDQRGATTFVVMSLAGLAWTTSEIVLVVAIDPSLQEVAYLSGAFWATVATAAFVVFASRYSNASLHRNRLIRVALGGIVASYALLAPTNHAHHLLFEPFTPTTDPFPYLMYDRGPAIATMVAVLSLLGLYAVYRVGRYLLSTGRRAGSQLALLMAGALSVVGLEVASTLGLMPLDEYNYAVYGLLPFNLCLALAVFRFSLLDIRPIARSSVVENLGDPVLVLDDDRTLVDYNDASVRVWPAIEGGLGDPFATVCPDVADDLDLEAESTADDGLVLPVGGQDRYFSVTVSTVGRDAGPSGTWYSILLRDVTELERSRTQLQAQNERLDQVASKMSHDLRNPMQVAVGNLDRLEAGLEELAIDPADRETIGSPLAGARRSLERMDSILEDVLTIARQGKTVEATEPVSLADVATDAWGNLETHDATLRIVGDRRFAADRSRLLTIFENLFRNSLEHGGRDATVAVGPTDDGFSVEDDGPGIPADLTEDVFEYG